MTKSTRFQLFLDESGRFMETSMDPQERGAGRQSFPSQLAGILAPSGLITAESATKVLAEAMEAVGAKFSGALHSSDHRPGGNFDSVITALADALQRRNWQPFRIVNTEGVSFGHRIENYTNIVAELCLRVFQALRLKGLKEVELELTCARVKLGEDEAGEVELLAQPEYARRIQELMTRAALRAGRAGDARGWKVSSTRLASARTDPELMVCDLVSNASHADFGKLGEEATARLRKAVGDFDFSMQVREDLQRVDGWLADGAYGFAVVHLADRLVDPALDPSLRKSLEARLHEVANRLSALGAPARNPQLEIVCSFLEETVRWIRDLERGQRLTSWMAGTFVPMLTQALAGRGEEQEIAWFAYAIQDRAVETCNHQGDLAGASGALQQLRLHEGPMVKRWEHVDRFLQGQIHEAVHLTDAREFATARDKAVRVADFHEQVGSLFQAALPEHFTTGVRSRRRGEALGTALQAEAYRCLVEADSFDVARELSAKAMEEFDQHDDLARQMQYRCQLEAMAGQHDEARMWLCHSMGLEESAGHELIAQGIRAVQNHFGRGFLLLHWLRLGAFLTRSHQPELAAEFVAALRSSKLDQDDWFSTGDDHPRQAILRYRTEIALASSDDVAANTCLNRLREVCLPVKARGAVLAFQLFACQALIARANAAGSPAKARKLLDNKEASKPGLRQLLPPLETALGELDEWRATLDSLGTAIESCIATRNPTPELFGPLTKAVNCIVL